MVTAKWSPWFFIDPMRVDCLLSQALGSGLHECFHLLHGLALRDDSGSYCGEGAMLTQRPDLPRGSPIMCLQSPLSLSEVTWRGR